MREIKFKYYSYFSDGGIATDECTLQEIEDGAFGKPYLSGIFARVQFTGLTDKNGVEIYEGDVVRITDDYENEPTIHKVTFGDSFGYPAFDLYPPLNCECNAFSFVFQGGEAEIEVIGNIYENPELLEVE